MEDNKNTLAEEQMTAGDVSEEGTYLYTTLSVQRTGSTTTSTTNPSGGNTTVDDEEPEEDLDNASNTKDTAIMIENFDEVYEGHFGGGQAHRWYSFVANAEKAH